MNKQNRSNQQNKDITNTKKKICIIGDSLLGGINSRGVSRKHTVTCKPWGGATTEDAVKLTEIALSREVDCVIYHFGTNDTTKLSTKKGSDGEKVSIDTLKQIDSAINLAKDANTELCHFR